MIITSFFFFLDRDRKPFRAFTTAPSLIIIILYKYETGSDNLNLCVTHRNALLSLIQRARFLK